VVFVRFESDQPDSAGFRAGVFLLANRLARSGRLTPEEWAFWRSGNDWYDAAYADPESVDPDPGTILYEDDVQVVVRPHPVEAHHG
jgi:hypothetical protein